MTCVHGQYGREAVGTEKAYGKRDKSPGQVRRVPAALPGVERLPGGSVFVRGTAVGACIAAILVLIAFLMERRRNDEG
ncbi:hypothetical protein [Pontibacter pamirensis]|uniref:hypothetical protein n=1 Tax=Pontibacter pamirensis TaxID=2562824 RepID=UPI0013893D8E|nr:hypothetical protein [Pontibacter pamirensis]